MKKLIALLSRKDVRNEDGATMIEYALIAGIIAIGAITVLGTVGTELRANFAAIATAL